MDRNSNLRTHRTGMWKCQGQLKIQKEANMKQMVLSTWHKLGWSIHAHTEGLFHCRLISPDVLAVGAAQAAVVTVEAAGVTSDAVQILAACCEASAGLTN